MHPYYYFPPLAMALALGVNSTVKAADALVLNKNSLPSVLQQFHISTPGSDRALTPSVNDLQYLQEHTDKNHINHVRMQQYYAGVPVHGGYAILHRMNKSRGLTAINSGDNINGTVYKGLEQDLGKPSADYLRNAAQALTQFKTSYATSEISEEQASPIVYIDEQHKAHWAYQVSILVKSQRAVPMRPTAIIDAKTNTVFIQWNAIKTDKAIVPGIGFGGNKKMGVYRYGKTYPLLDLTRDSSTNKCSMENPDVKVIDMDHGYDDISEPMNFACVKDTASDAYFTGYKGNGYDKINGAASPANDALYAGYVIKHMYHDWYNLNALTEKDGNPMQLVMRVHFGEDYENAYWDGLQMTFGDGGYILYPLVSLGVASHEISHGFTEQHSNLEYYGQSGGMNESFSDMASQAAEFYSTGKNSWQIGPEVIKDGFGLEALRYMDVPSKDGTSIDTANDYYGGLDVHYSSGVYNRLFYILSTSRGWNVRKAFDIFVKANVDYWTPYSTFDEGSCGLLQAAKDLGYSLEDVQKALDKVTINYAAC